MEKYIAYYRVSTDMQGISGLGLDAQRSMVRSFSDEFVEEYTEIESGRNNNRPIIEKAIAHCIKIDATLIISSLDRLSRDVEFIARLQNSKVKFRCCDMPSADEFTINILAAVAQQEAKSISLRTTRALNELKKRGVKLGNPYKGGEIKKDGERAKVPLGYIAMGKSIATRKIQALTNENNMRAKLLIEGMLVNGLSYSKIAKMLNMNGFRTSKDSKFTAMQVSRLARRDESYMMASGKERYTRVAPTEMVAPTTE